MRAILFCCAFLTAAAIANPNGPEGRGKCRDKHEARLQTRKTLEQCLKGWWNANPKLNESSEDCTPKLNAYVEAAKAFRACRAENKPPHP